MALDVNAKGNLTLTSPHVDVAEMRESCSLDVAERWGGASLGELAELLGVSYHRVDHVVSQAVRRFVEVAVELRMPALTEAAPPARAARGPRGLGLARGRGPRRGQP